MTMYPDDCARKHDPTKDSRWSSLRKLNIKANILRGKISKHEDIDKNMTELKETNDIIKKLLKEINKDKMKNEN